MFSGALLLGPSGVGEPPAPTLPSDVTLRTPPLIVTTPVNVLAPPSVCVPAPILVSPVVPLRTPVWTPLLLPTCRVIGWAASSTIAKLPGPASAPTVNVPTPP
jgi:hypothetical protein